MPDETDLIRKLTRAIPSFVGTKGLIVGVPFGIGDDAAVLRARAGMEWAVTVDAFVEDVHFWVGRHPADSVGYKALARATSDLAAMGAKPRFFVLTLALPRAQTGAWLDQMAAGMGRAARALGLKLVGGDTTRAQAVSISITVIGEIAPGRALTRTGARPGDTVFVSGRLGEAALGLELVRRGFFGDRRMFDPVARHLYPEIRVELGAWLSRNRHATAMIDISDGLSTDLARVCDAGSVGARLYAEKIPCVEISAEIAKRLGKQLPNPLKMALHGGDDYELLFTVPKRYVPKLIGKPAFKKAVAIGEIVPGSGISLVGEDSKETKLAAGGWDPFREK
jgi:thiamine-monophosphate kinase